MIGRLLVLVGSLLVLLGAVGMVRFRDVFARMHALTKASATGTTFVLIGAAVTLSHPNDVTSLLLATVLQLLTVPVAANVLSRATHRAEGIPIEVHTVDELAEDLPDDESPR